MENFHYADTLEDSPSYAKGFSKAQILQLSVKDIEQLDLIEHPMFSSNGDESREQSDKDVGPRPPQEEDFPDDEKEELFSEVSDPEEED
ncbi:MAG TPA: hypothetical protein VKX33_05515 [Cyclobacteriaceae bacterium]|nr:hypothetical protein [Cyclobacteriaceae bacterium]